MAFIALASILTAIAIKISWPAPFSIFFPPLPKSFTMATINAIIEPSAMTAGNNFSVSIEATFFNAPANINMDMDIAIINADVLPTFLRSPIYLDNIFKAPINSPNNTPIPPRPLIKSSIGIVDNNFNDTANIPTAIAILTSFLASRSS